MGTALMKKAGLEKSKVSQHLTSPYMILKGKKEKKSGGKTVRERPLPYCTIT